MPLKFLHIRNKTADGKISNFGGATLGFDHIDGNLFVSLARCCPVDNFNKKIGRTIAENRFNRGDIFKVECNGNIMLVSDCLISWFYSATTGI